MKKALIIIIPIVVLALVVAGFGYGYHRYNQLAVENNGLTSKIAELQNSLKLINERLATTTGALNEQLERNNSIVDQVQGMASEVTELGKLSKTDRELLKKYSRVYFLNENYVPLSLATVTPAFLLDSRHPLLIHAQLQSRLESMLNEASSSGSLIKIASAYRSFGTQAALKSKYLMTYGAGSNKFSADQGYSEHQLGTAIDLVSASSTSLSLNFDKTTAFAWLRDNAYRYGFVLSYPKGNSYYQYEPWHWRYVGVALATKLHNDHENFYDISQRIIDKFLANIFD